MPKVSLMDFGLIICQFISDFISKSVILQLPKRTVKMLNGHFQRLLLVNKCNLSHCSHCCCLANLRLRLVSRRVRLCKLNLGLGVRLGIENAWREGRKLSKNF